MLKLISLFISILLLAPSVWAEAAPGKAGKDVSIVFSSSVYGETEPCG